MSNTIVTSHGSVPPTIAFLLQALASPETPKPTAGFTPTAAVGEPQQVRHGPRPSRQGVLCMLGF